MTRERRVLAELIRRKQPAAICCTFPAYAFILDALARQRGLAGPFFNVVTDSISINSRTRGAAETARRLLTETPWEITCTFGRNNALREELERCGAFRAAKCRILGWIRFRRAVPPHNPRWVIPDSEAAPAGAI